MKRAFLSLTPAEAKVLLARAAASHPAVRRALSDGFVIVTLGTTNAAVASELLGEPVDALRFAAGIVQGGYPCASPAAERLPPLVLERGERSDLRPDEAIARGGAKAVVLKGGNAVDPERRVGVLMASPEGGTVGQVLVRAVAVGATLLSPVGLEKLVPSVPAAVRALGQARLDRSLGARCGMMELVGAEALTEVDAFRILADVGAVHVASGGTAGSEGSTTFAVTGAAAHVDRAVELVRGLKASTPPRPAAPHKPPCETCQMRCDLAGK